MTYTENYHLKKPDGDDFIDVADLNQNMDAIDAQLKAQAQKAEGDGTKVQEVQAALEQKADLKNGKVPAEQLPEMDYIASSDRGAPGGVATLGSDGKVPEGQLPAMNYDPKGTAVTAVSNHNSSAGAHADIRQAVANTQAAVQQAASALQSGLSSHTGNKDNPHAVTKEQIGLGQADNTSDADKPISKATQKALDQLSDDLEQVAGMTLLGGGAGAGNWKTRRWKPAASSTLGQDGTPSGFGRRSRVCRMWPVKWKALTAPFKSRILRQRAFSTACASCPPGAITPALRLAPSRATAPPPWSAARPPRRPPSRSITLP